MTGRPAERGALAIVLHTHMPYVEGFGTWPFGEEWLWEAMAVCYLPLLDVLDRHPGALTLSLTPVLCDQLAAPGVADRFERFLVDVRRATHAEDAAGLRAASSPGLAAEVERAAADYERALERHQEVDRDLLGALLRHAAWTSAASHAVLPLCATEAGARAQIQLGVAAHRSRSQRWHGGFWLPECAYAAWLAPLLAEAQVRACCVDLTDRYGHGAAEHLTPLRAGPGGPVLVPIDRATIELVWSDGGYPAHGGYRDYHRHTVHHHRPWGNDGEPYDRAAAEQLVVSHAADFVARVSERVAGGGLAVCALDTELLGHWWYEGMAWLEAVLAEAACQDLAVVNLDDALTGRQLADPGGPLGVSSWGTPRDLSTWDGPAVADVAFAARDAELRVIGAGPAATPLAVRQLLAVQSSDWAFMVDRDLAGDYPLERAAGHRRALDAALGAPATKLDGIRNLAPLATSAPLLCP